MSVQQCRIESWHHGFGQINLMVTWEHMLSKIRGCQRFHSLRPSGVRKGNDLRTCPFDQESMSTAYIRNQTGGLHLTVRHVLHWLSLNGLSESISRVLALGYPGQLLSIQDTVARASPPKGPNPSEPQQQSDVKHSMCWMPSRLHWLIGEVFRSLPSGALVIRKEWRSCNFHSCRACVLV